MSQAERKAVNLHPAIHVRDNGDGTMTARSMFESESAHFTFAARNYLTAAQRYLASRWPNVTYSKTGWSANASEAVYHFIGTIQCNCPGHSKPAHLHATNCPIRSLSREQQAEQAQVRG